MTQKARLLGYLQSHPEGITTLVAFGTMGICRLSERVRELEALDYVIQHTPIEVLTRNGVAHVMSYRLVSEPDKCKLALTNAESRMDIGSSEGESGYVSGY